MSNTSANKKISAETVQQKIQANAPFLLIDVRSKAEYKESHIPNSISIPLALLAPIMIEKYPNKDTEIVLYCLSGTRSAMALKALMVLGYTNVKNLGGINNWPFETTSLPTTK